MRDHDEKSRATTASCVAQRFDMWYYAYKHMCYYIFTRHERKHMAAFKMDELVRLEAEYGVEAGDLSYQKRCSRMTALTKGEQWENTPPEPKKAAPKVKKLSRKEALEGHPLYGKTLWLTPLMLADKNRNLYYDEVVGHEIEVAEAHAGKMLYGQPEEMDRMVGDYEIIREDINRPVVAKTTVPKIGTEIKWTLGKDLVPVVRGADGQRGYIWSFPTHTRQVGDSVIQMYGLKTLIMHTYPELLEKFKGKPMMTYIDGFTLAASIPLTHAAIKEHRRREMADARAGLV